jgi:hypothetical protein
VRFLALPALVVTGIAMWQAPRIRRLRKRFRATRLGSSRMAPPVEPGTKGVA